MLEKVKRIVSVDLNKLINISIAVMLLGFIVNACVLQLSRLISNEFCKIIDFSLLIIEGIILFFSLFRILLRNPKKIITIYGVSILIFLINYLIFPLNRSSMLMIIKEFFLYDLTMFILFLEVSKDKSEFEKIVKTTRFVFLFSILYLIILISTNQSIYNVWLASYFFLTIIFALYDLYKYKSKISAFINVICFIMLFITGSRTYLITYIICAIMLIIKKLIKYMKNITQKKKIAIFIIIFILIILLINYKAVANSIYDFFYERNIDIRILRLIATDNFFISNDRKDIIYPVVVNLIKHNLLVGTGIGGDRVAIYNKYEELGKIGDGYTVNAYYSHNFILELCSNFGVILSIAFIVVIIYRYYKKIREDKNSIPLLVCLSFISIFPLMLNNTLWNDMYLWALLGVLFSRTIQNKQNEQENKKNSNIIMLLDNAFDPDVRVFKEAKYLVDNGINVKILCMDKRNKYKSKENDNYNGIKIKRFFPRTDKTTRIIENSKVISKFKSVIYFWWLIKFIYQIKKYLNNENFEILHCHDLTMAFIGCLFFGDKKIIFDMHEYYGDNNSKVKNFIINKIVSYTQNKSNWIIYVNEYQKSKCKLKNHEKLIEIPNYPEKGTFKDILKTESSKIRISYIGKVRDFNSLSILIDNSTTSDKIDVAIYGDGSEFEQLLDYSKQKEQENIIKGRYDGIREVENIYKNTDILYAVYDINSRDGINWKNAMPIKSYEAIITLTPIIANKNTILGKFIEKENIGFTIDGIDYNELNELLEKIINNPNLLKDKYDNIKKIQYLYIWENVIKNIDKIYFND